MQAAVGAYPLSLVEHTKRWEPSFEAGSVVTSWPKADAGQKNRSFYAKALESIAGSVVNYEVEARLKRFNDERRRTWRRAVRLRAKGKAVGEEKHSTSETRTDTPFFP